MKKISNRNFTDDNTEISFGNKYHLIEVNRDGVITGYVKSNTFGSHYPYPTEYILYNDFDKAMEFANKHRGQFLINIKNENTENIR